MDSEAVLAWVGAVGAVLSIGLTLLHWYRRHELGRSRLTLWLGEGGVVRAGPFRRATTYKPDASFYFSRSHSSLMQLIPLTINLHNPSKKPVRDILVELRLPSRFVRSNQDILASYEGNPEAFGDNADFHISMTHEILKVRTVQIEGEFARVHYVIETIRPGQSHLISEMLRVRPDRTQDARYVECAYGNVERRWKASSKLRASLVIEATAFSSDTMPQESRLELSLLDTASEQESLDAVEAFRLAHWFGTLPRPGYYFSPAWPRGRSVTRRLRAELVELRPSLVSLQRSDGKRSMGLVTDPVDLPVTLFEMNVPGFDEFRAPASINSLAAALAWSATARLGGLPRRNKRTDKQTAARSLSD